MNPTLNALRDGDNAALVRGNRIRFRYLGGRFNDRGTTLPLELEHELPDGAPVTATVNGGEIVSIRLRERQGLDSGRGISRQQQ